MLDTILVTGLMDIGRGNLNNKFNRSIDEYLKYLENVCKLDNFLVIWITKDLYDKVYEYRNNYINKTIFIIFNINELDYIEYINKFDVIIDRYKKLDFERDDAIDAIEYTFPIYNVIINNKFKFIKKTKDLNLFNGIKYYIWIDAGYTSNNYDMTNKSISSLKIDKIYNYTDDNKLLLTKLFNYDFPDDMTEFQKKYPLDIFSGGLVIYKKEMIDKFYLKMKNLILSSLNDNIFDDDQFYLTMLYCRNKDLFQTYNTNDDWYELFYKIID